MSDTPYIGLSATMGLTKINRETGEVTEIAPTSNTFLSTGFDSIANVLARRGPVTTWGAGSMRLKIYVGQSLSTTLVPGTASITITVNRDPVRNQIVVQWSDATSSTYDLSGGGRVVVASGNTSSAPELAQYTSVTPWGDKTSSETWVFTWTVSISTSNATGAAWGGNAKNIILARLIGESSPYNYTGPVLIRATDDSSNPSYDLALTGIASSRSGATWEIVSKRRGDANRYTLRGERVYIGQVNVTGLLITWTPSAALQINANETLTVNHTFTIGS